MIASNWHTVCASHSHHTRITLVPHCTTSPETSLLPIAIVVFCVVPMMLVWDEVRVMCKTLRQGAAG